MSISPPDAATTHQLVLQGDANLVRYALHGHAWTASWATDTSGLDLGVTTLRVLGDDDCDVVLENEMGSRIWSLRRDVTDDALYSCDDPLKNRPQRQPWKKSRATIQQEYARVLAFLGGCVMGIAATIVCIICCLCACDGWLKERSTGPNGPHSSAVPAPSTALQPNAPSTRYPKKTTCHADPCRGACVD